MSVTPLDPYGIIKASGFPFQERVKLEFQAASKQGWVVVNDEHPYRTDTGPDEDRDYATRYVDLIVARNGIHLVIECKKTEKESWVFVNPSEAAQGPIGVCHQNERGLNIQEIDLGSPIETSSICVIERKDKNHRFSLENMAHGLTTAALAVAAQQFRLQPPADRTTYWLPTIITNAPLYSALFDVSQVSLETGHIPEEDVALEVVPLMLFRKSLSPPRPGSHRRLNLLGAATERSVLVICAKNLETCLPTLANLHLA